MWTVSHSFELSRNLSRKTNWFSPLIQQQLWYTGSTQNTANSTWINHSFIWPVACSFAPSSLLSICRSLRRGRCCKLAPSLLPLLCPEIEISRQILEVDKPDSVCKVRLCHPWNTHPLFILLFLPWTCNLHIQNKRLNHNMPMISPTAMCFYG